MNPRRPISARVALRWAALRLVVLIVVWGFPGAASAFYILSPKTPACHERLTLTALDGEHPDAAGLLEALSGRVAADGVPDDEATRAFIDELADRHGFDDRRRAVQYVLASFVAGVRQPDTDGLSVIKFNETRSVHLQDDNQPRHSLRMTGHDHGTGDRRAIERARELILDRLDGAHKSWQPEADLLARARWSFAFYGEVEVYVVWPAFELGRGAHAIQDAYAHALRDDEMRIVAVSNFVDLVEQRYFEPRDGPAHSDRLDECNADESAFDEMRVDAAREATARFFAQVAAAFTHAVSRERLHEMVAPVLDDIYDFRDGCTVDDDYCHSAWAPLARSDLTEPYDWSLCSTSADTQERRPGAYLWVGLVWLYGLWRLLKSRSRQSTA